jgi:hypothetical protein
MALNTGKLENVRKGPGGGVRAGCPACAAKGEDTRKEHLYIYPDGRFGCAKYPKDKTHRSVIAKLVGLREVGSKPTFIPIKSFKTPKHTLKRVFGTDGTPFYNLRAYAKNNIIHNKSNTARVIGLEKPVPTVPDLDKSMIINDDDENVAVPAEIEAQIRSWGWLWEAVKGWDARLVGASWDGEQYGEQSRAV